MNKRIFLSPPHMGGNEQKYIKEAFDINYIAPLGPNVDKFEESICEKTGAKYCAALTSGTAAIHLALIILGVEQGDEVLCSSFTFCGSVNPVMYQKATPVFVDCEEDTWNISPELLEEAILDRIKVKGEKPKAIILVHLYGMPAKIDEIMAISKKYNIPVIEDAAEAIGATYKGQALGTFGDFGVFSFNGNKIITTSGGGVLVSENEKWIQKARFLSTQARDNEPYYQHSEIGYNYRMSNVIAGIGRGQMEVLDERVEQCRSVNKFYTDIFSSVEGITMQTEPNKDFYSNFWLSTILVDKDKLGVSNEEIRLKLESENIEARHLWKPMHLQPVFADCPAYLNGNSNMFFEKGLCLPSGTSMTEDDKTRIKTALAEFI